MPLLLSRNSENQRLFLWEFTQNELEFTSLLGEEFVKNVQAKHKLHKRALEKLGFLALLKSAGIASDDLHYDNHGKPHIKNGPAISFSHSRDRAVLLISEMNSCGIDLEVDNEKILKIAAKFMSKDELNSFTSEKEKYWIWSIKEAVFKYLGHNVDFRKDMRMSYLSVENKIAKVDYSGPHGKGIFDVRLESFDEYKAAMTIQYEEKI